MAKVTGPLMSMDASGGFGGALVFGKWKGRNVVHQLVKPANPQSADQESARNRIRVTGAIQRQMNLSVAVKAAKTGTDKVRLAGITPAGFAWNGYLTDILIGNGAVSYAAAEAAWGALAAGEKTAWDVAAAGLTPAYTAVYQTVAGGGAGVNKTAGFAFFAHSYALYLAGLDTVPGAVPPVYA